MDKHQKEKNILIAIILIILVLGVFLYFKKDSEITVKNAVKRKVEKGTDFVLQRDSKLEKAEKAIKKKLANSSFVQTAGSSGSLSEARNTVVEKAEETLNSIESTVNKISGFNPGKDLEELLAEMRAKIEEIRAQITQSYGKVNDSLYKVAGKSDRSAQSADPEIEKLKAELENLEFSQEKMGRVLEIMENKLKEVQENLSNLSLEPKEE